MPVLAHVVIPNRALSSLDLLDLSRALLCFYLHLVGVNPYTHTHTHTHTLTQGQICLNTS